MIDIVNRQSRSGNYMSSRFLLTSMSEYIDINIKLEYEVKNYGKNDVMVFNLEMKIVVSRNRFSYTTRIVIFTDDLQHSQTICNTFRHFA